jgi:general secretion pathway protein D
MESDTQTKIVAKPQLRGAEGTKLTLNLGQETPIVTTSYQPIATGGAGVNPLNSFQLKPVGINMDITPLRVTLEGDLLIELNLESSSKLGDVNIAGTNYPSFGSRKVGTRLRLRDGESNLLAGLLREEESKGVSGFPGAIHVPGLKQLFSYNDQSSQQTDIVMLLTPHIIRAPAVTEADLRPIYIGSQGTLGIGGPPPLIAAPEPADIGTPPDPATTPGASAPRSPATAPGAAPIGTPALPPGATLANPPGSTPVPGTVLVPAPAPATPPPAPTPATPAPQPPQAVPAGPPPSAADTTPPAVVPGLGSAQVFVSPPGNGLRVGGGPYSVTISITNATRLSTMTLTVTFDPALLRPRQVNEGSFMRSGGATATFTQQVGPGRIDVTIIRSSDAVGATGTGLLAAVLFDAIAPGSATLGLSGSGTGPGGAAMGLQFRSATVTIQP